MQRRRWDKGLPEGSDRTRLGQKLWQQPASAAQVFPWVTLYHLRCLHLEFECVCVRARPKVYDTVLSRSRGPVAPELTRITLLLDHERRIQEHHAKMEHK